MVTTDLLSQIQVFSVLSPRTQRCIAEKALQSEYPARHVLYHQGDAPTALYALCAGRIKLFRQSGEKCQILALPMAGDCLGAESLSTGSPSPYSATTLTSASVFYLAPEIMQVLLDEHPDFQEVYLKLITDRLKQFVTLVHDLAFRDVTSRLATILLSRAELEGEDLRGELVFDKLLSQQEFADMAGTAREVVYRTFRKLEEQEVIRLTPGTITICNINALREIALQETR